MGTRNSEPDSRRPRRLPKAMISTDDERHRQDPRTEHGKCRGDRGDARRRRHGDGQDVVGEQCDPGDLGGDDAEVVERDDVGAAGRGVLLDRLPVRERQEEQHHQHRDGEGDEQREGGDAHGDHQHPEDLLRRVRRRRDAVRREDGQGGRVAQPLVLEVLGVERRAQQLRLEPVAERLGDGERSRGRERSGAVALSGFDARSAPARWRMWIDDSHRDRSSTRGAGPRQVENANPDAFLTRRACVRPEAGSVASTSMHIIVVGCGRVGAELATTLANRPLTAPTRSPSSTRTPRPSPGWRTSTARPWSDVGFDHDTLVAAGVERADALAGGDQRRQLEHRRRPRGQEQLRGRPRGGPHPGPGPGRDLPAARQSPPSPRCTWTTDQVIRRLSPETAVDASGPTPTARIRLVELDRARRLGRPQASTSSTSPAAGGSWPLSRLGIRH